MMKKIKIFFMICICIAAIAVLLNFNFEKEYASPIDNRMLTEWDLDTGDMTGMVDAYLKDRIGFRTEAIDTYTELNDKLFHIMIHPSYTYGKEGYVFGKMSYELPDEGFYDLFCQFLLKVQTYCEERGVPFIYCLNPSKTTIYEKYLPEGYIYQNKVNQIMGEKLEEYGINYITNEQLLKEKSEDEQVYNKKYDAGHWNDLGAFYGTDHILEKVKEYFPDVQLLKKSDFEIKTTVMTSLPVSYFEIDEEVPVFVDKNGDNIKDHTSLYGSLKMEQNYPEFAYLVNENENAKKLPRVLVFQGSYYNSRRNFFQSAFQEYYSVHNYYNFIDFDYYFNIFQPDCVILETAEYATNGTYFPYNLLEEKQLNPKLDIEKYQNEFISLNDTNYTLSEEGNLLTITMPVGTDVERGYLIVGDKTYDLKIHPGEKYADCTLDKKGFQSELAKVFWQ